MHQVFSDGKEFVDMPMKFDPEIIVERWEEQEGPFSNVTSFVENNFYAAGSDMVDYIPLDWQEEPSFLSTIQQPDFKIWAFELNGLWKNLVRKVSPAVIQAPQRHSYVPRSRPMVVPGGRFRESYYWDSLWIVKGLLVCDMAETANDVVQNLLDDVEAFGFVPNGGRIYFLDRSQPPVLSEMVCAMLEYYDARAQQQQGTDREEALALANALLVRAWPLLKKEYHYWMSEHHAVTIMVGSKSFVANRYGSTEQTPRPESYREDVMTAAGGSADGAGNETELFNALRAGAETGWDFSSRFIQPALSATVQPLPLATKENYEHAAQIGAKQFPMSNERAPDVLPVDLNSMMLRFESNMLRLSALPAVNAPADEQAHWQAAVTNRVALLSEVMWSAKLGRWTDVDADSLEQLHLCAAQDEAGKCTVFHAHVGEYMPLWAMGLDMADSNRSLALGQVKRAVATLEGSGLLEGEVGPLTTTLATGQQWDAPNVWAPLVLLTVEGLANGGARALSDRIADAFLRAAHAAYLDTGYMFEKYNAFAPGQTGGGGEYEPQVGFGWTNGVILHLLARRAAKLN